MNVELRKLPFFCSVCTADLSGCGMTHVNIAHLQARLKKVASTTVPCTLLVDWVQSATRDHAHRTQHSALRVASVV